MSSSPMRLDLSTLPSPVAPRWLTLAFLLAAPLCARDVQPELPNIPDRVVDAAECGAVADGKADDTHAIQEAVDKVAKQGGGTIRLSRGTFLSGPIHLASHVRFQIDGGVTLLMLPLSRYPGGNRVPEDFLGAKGLTDIAITGGGTIDGQGADWWPFAKDKPKKPRPRMIGLHGCQRILIEGLTLRNSPMFHIAIRADDVTVSKVTIRAPSSRDKETPSHNTDACDVSGHRILVQDCDVSVGDDNFTCGRDTSDVLIRNCRYGTGHGVSIGSYTQGEIRNFTVRDCTFDGTQCGIRIKTDRDRGGHLSGIVYENLRMTNVQIPILVYAAYHGKEHGKVYGDLVHLSARDALAYPSMPVGPTTPFYEDITFRNITAEAAPGGRAGLIWGLPESPVGRLVMENVTIKADLPLGIYNVRQAALTKVRITTPDGENRISQAAANITLVP